MTFGALYADSRQFDFNASCFIEIRSWDGLQIVERLALQKKGEREGSQG